jgi:hypothetical protein
MRPIVERTVRWTYAIAGKLQVRRAMSSSASGRALFVDPNLVNAHDVVVRSQTDRKTLQVLRMVRRGLRLLRRGETDASAKRLFEQAEGVTNGMRDGCATANENNGQTIEHPAAWVACNALGLSLFFGAKHEQAEAAFREAQRHCEILSRKGLINDAFSDMGGVLCDRAANIINSGQRQRVSEAVGMLKRAKFMAERAYRPNYLLIDSLNGNLAVALLQEERDLEQALVLAQSAVRTGDAMEALMTGVRGEGSKLRRSQFERTAHAKGLAVVALLSAKLGSVQEALATAARLHSTLFSSRETFESSPLEAARLNMCLSSVHSMAATQLASHREAQSALKQAVQHLEEATSLLDRGNIRKTHPDHVVCRINHVMARRSLFYLTAALDLTHSPQEVALEHADFSRDKAWGQAALRILRKRPGANQQVGVLNLRP